MAGDDFVRVMEFVLRWGTDWRFWVALGGTSVALCLWRAKRFRFVVEYQSKD